MNFKTLAEQSKALFSGTVLLTEYYCNIENFEEDAMNSGVSADFIDLGYPMQVYAVELRTDYELNVKEYEAAGVIYSDSLGAYIWPIFSCGTSWQTAEPQNIYTDCEDY